MGYMASGKSLIGNLLSKKLNYDFLDLDDFIESEEEKAISEIFKEKGEIYFRKRESELLKSVIQSKENLVLSLGGGTPCYANNISVVNSNENVVSIYLKASVDTIVNRLKHDKQVRPLVSHLDSSQLEEFVRKHLFERTFYYNQSKTIISVDNKTVDEIIEEIIIQLF